MSEILVFDSSLSGIVAARALDLDVVVVPKLQGNSLKNIKIKDSFLTFHEINFPSIVELSPASSDN